MIPNSKDGINRGNCSPKSTHDGRLRFVCNCPCFMSSPMPAPCMTWNYFGLKKRKFKGKCHLLCQTVPKSHTLVFSTCKMPAMQIHYRPIAVTCFQILVQLHFMPGSTGLMTRIFWRKMFPLTMSVQQTQAEGAQIAISTKYIVVEHV